MRARDVKEDRRDLLLVRGEEGAQPLRRLQRHTGRQRLGLVGGVAEQQKRDVCRVGVAVGPDLADIERAKATAAMSWVCSASVSWVLRKSTGSDAFARFLRDAIAPA